MLLPRKHFFTLADISKRWGVSVRDLGCYALEDALVLSAVINGADAEVGAYVEGPDGEALRVPEGRRRLAGAYDLFGSNVWPVFKGERAMIRRLRPKERDAYIDIEAPAEGVEIGLADLVMTRAERDRFEAEHGLAAPSASMRSADAAGLNGRPGAPPRYDWNGFWIAVCRRIRDGGWPETQAALVRDLMDWFSATTETFPDESTVRKKLSHLWRTSRAA